MFVVGLTGGIGSGKSAVADRFADLGIKVVDADQASRAVVEPGSRALAAIREHFGPSVINADGTLNRAALRKRVFAEDEERRWLEALLHPRIAEYLDAALSSAHSPYAVLVSPLLLESSQARLAHRILVVDVPESLQIERTMARDGNSEEEVRNIMASQSSREQRLAAADDVIVNDGDLEWLDEEVERLHTLYLALARED